MRAVIVRQFGGPDALELVELPVPEPENGQVRIRVAAASVNPVDIATRVGALTQIGMIPPREQLGLGWDVAGVVDALGPRVTGFATGDRVIGLSDRLALDSKAHAEYIVLDATDIARAPRNASPAEVATLPLNALTAEQSLDLLGLRVGQTLLVTGAAGGLGGYAAELGARRGLRVVAVAGDGDEELVRGLGAELFVPRSADLAASVRLLVPGGVDGAIDAAVIGAPALDAVRGGGSFIAVVAGGAPLPLRGTRVETVWVRADGARLDELVSLVDAGRLTLRVADTYRLEDVAYAHERIEKGGLRGRLVLIP